MQVFHGNLKLNHTFKKKKKERWIQKQSFPRDTRHGETEKCLDSSGH